MKSRIETVLSAVVLSMCISGVAAASSTNWASEAPFNGYQLCLDVTEVAGSLACSGEYCAEIMADCYTPGPVMGATTQTPYFSEENGGQGFCPSGSVVNGFDVAGYDNRGDNISLSCVELIDSVEDTPNCYWSEWISEEDPYPGWGPLPYAGSSVSCDDPLNQYVHGMQCDGGWCDNMRIYCCPYIPDSGGSSDVIDLGNVNDPDVIFTIEAGTTVTVTITQLDVGYSVGNYGIGFGPFPSGTMENMTANLGGPDITLSGGWYQTTIPYAAQTEITFTITNGKAVDVVMKANWWANGG